MLQMKALLILHHQEALDAPFHPAHLFCLKDPFPLSSRRGTAHISADIDCSTVCDVLCHCPLVCFCFCLFEHGVVCTSSYLCIFVRFLLPQRLRCSWAHLRCSSLRSHRGTSRPSPGWEEPCHPLP